MTYIPVVVAEQSSSAANIKPSSQHQSASMPAEMEMAGQAGKTNRGDDEARQAESSPASSRKAGAAAAQHSNFAFLVASSTSSSMHDARGGAGGGGGGGGHGVKRSRGGEETAAGGAAACNGDVPMTHQRSSPQKLRPSGKDTPSGRGRSRSPARVNLSGDGDSIVSGGGVSGGGYGGRVSGGGDGYGGRVSHKHPRPAPSADDNTDGTAPSPPTVRARKELTAPGGGGEVSNSSGSKAGALCGSGGETIASAISGMFLCCSSYDACSPTKRKQNNQNQKRELNKKVSELTSSLSIPAVVANNTMGSVGADLLLEEENTHGRRGIDQVASMDSTSGAAAEDVAADVNAMSEDMALLQEARRGAQRTALGSPKPSRKGSGGGSGGSGDIGNKNKLRRLGSSLAQSRADSMNDLAGSGAAAAAAAGTSAPSSTASLAALAEASKSNDDDAKGVADDADSAEEKKVDSPLMPPQDHSFTLPDSPASPTSRKKLLKKSKSTSGVLRGKIKSVFKKSSSKSFTTKDDADRSIGSSIPTDGGSTVEFDHTDAFPAEDSAGRAAQKPKQSVGSMLQESTSPPPAPLVDASLSSFPVSFAASSSDSFELNDLAKQKSLPVIEDPPARHVFGPTLGSFNDVSDVPTSNNRKELVGTYRSYRMDPYYVHHIIANMDTVLPLHHHEKSLAGSKVWDSVSDLANMRGCCESYDNGKAVKNVCSEPSASSLKVRGGTYLKDSVKVGSAESMFSLLGVDNIFKKSSNEGGGVLHWSAKENSYLYRLRSVCKDAEIDVPFLLVINFVLPWGNLMAYMYRPDGIKGGPFNETLEEAVPSERLWRKFVEGDDAYRNKRLKFIPRIVEAPWLVKKMVGTAPALIGQKLPTSYYGSVEQNYLEICLDVTAGPQIANSIATTVAGKSDLVTVDLAFLVEGLVDDEELPEQLLAVYRLHHVNMKKTFNEAQWLEEVKQRQTLRKPDVDGIEML